MIHSFPALGTQWWIEVWDDVSPETFAILMKDIEGFVFSFEQKYSRFISTSVVSTLNTQRVLTHPDQETLEILSYGKMLYLRTNTHFNILTGHILEARGYDASYSFSPTSQNEPTLGNPISDLHISPEKIEISHGNLDLGGFGKGYLIDAVARRLNEKHSIAYFLINAGGDMYGTSNHSQPIPIYLEHPMIPGTTILQTTLLNEGFAASSTHKRQWTKDDTTYTHIITDKSSQTASFIKHCSATEADVFATTALIADQKEMERLSAQEKCGLAYFNPDTNQLTSNKMFLGEKM